MIVAVYLSLSIYLSISMPKLMHVDGGSPDCNMQRARKQCILPGILGFGALNLSSWSCTAVALSPSLDVG